MKATLLSTAACVGIFSAGLAAAQSQAYEDGYRKGFQDGFVAGQKQAVPAQGVVPQAPASNVAPAPVIPAAPVQAAPVPNYGIAVMRASYGDGRRECMLTGALAGRMNGRSSASLEVSNQLCGDPAPGERKTLRVDYTCGGGVKQASAPEHRTLYLSCP